jgi:hypothetical protein
MRARGEMPRSAALLLVQAEATQHVQRHRLQIRDVALIGCLRPRTGREKPLGDGAG